MRVLPLLTITSVLGLGLLGASPAPAASTGGAGYEPAESRSKAAAAVPVAAATFPGPPATIGADGLAVAPPQAPPEVHAAIAAANRIVGKPYKYGGGHAKVEDTGYDCSGTVSYALIAAGLLQGGVPLDSRGFMRWGVPGPGTWITVYSNRGHAFVVIAGLRLDTSAAGDPSRAKGPRWRPALRSKRGFRVRHFDGL